MVRVLILNGSPRKKGNTLFLVSELAEQLRAKNNFVKILHLNDYDIKPCQSCYWCYRDFPLQCIQDDVMNGLYPHALDAEVIIFASPIYWFTYSAQLKLFVDRLLALHVKGGHSFQGKKFASIFVYGASNPEGSGVFNAIKSVEQMISYFGGENIGVVYGTGGDKLTAKDNPEILRKIGNLVLTISNQ
ncbi:MAG: flavodoxin family protein [Candidatus Heimdallarchaeota archaeon]|nr:flavodoxin family protein [Candidatus Heimdallarchaeota archaeon]